MRAVVDDCQCIPCHSCHCLTRSPDALEIGIRAAVGLGGGWLQQWMSAAVNERELLSCRQCQPALSVHPLCHSCHCLTRSPDTLEIGIRAAVGLGGGWLQQWMSAAVNERELLSCPQCQPASSVHPLCHSCHCLTRSPDALVVAIRAIFAYGGR
jgi:hypothetical protein